MKIFSITQRIPVLKKKTKKPDFFFIFKNKITRVWVADTCNNPKING